MLATLGEILFSARRFGRTFPHLKRAYPNGALVESVCAVCSPACAARLNPSWAAADIPVYNSKHVRMTPAQAPVDLCETAREQLQSWQLLRPMA